MDRHVNLEKVIVAAYGACALGMVGLHIAGFVTGNQRLHTIAWYALGCALVIGFLPLLSAAVVSIYEKLKRHDE